MPSPSSGQRYAGRYLAIRLPRPSAGQVLVAGAASTVAIGALGLLQSWTGSPWVAAGLGASCVLVFFAPEAPFSQPVNVVGGHICTAAVGLLVGAVLPVRWWSVALAVGLGIAAMTALRLTHPPAGGNPVAILAAGGGWSWLVVPFAAGAVLIVVLGVVVHRARRQPYPAALP